MLAPDINPVAFALGPLKVHWYGLMYLLGFGAGWWLGAYRTGRPNSGWQRSEVGDVLFYIVLGVILGGRLGYVLFYKPAYYFANPIEIFFIWQGGMAFHGALIGVIVAMWLYARQTKRRFFAVADFVAPLTPIGLGAGRIGNFINQELWGRPTDMPWAMIFTRTDPQQLPRHPSQLYEFALEGILLFVILWLYSSRPRPTGAVSGVFLVGYGMFRFLVEFYRSPDGYVGFLTMGQALSLPMIIAGLILIGWGYRTASRTVP